jgi:hypothetical protein
MAHDPCVTDGSNVGGQFYNRGRGSAMSQSKSTDTLDELIFLKLGLDLTRKEAQYPFVPAKDLAEFRAGVLAYINTRILAALEGVERNVIGPDEAPKSKPESKDVHERLGTCWMCYEDDYCYHEVHDSLRQDQRKALELEKERYRNEPKV